MQLQKLLTSAETAARDAGQILREMQHQVRPREKGPKDLVTEADLASQASIQQKLTGDFPDFSFIGEEDEQPNTEIPPDQPCWIVDPLDGTTNYVHGLDNYSVSIALQAGGEIVLAVIFDPVLDLIYTALRGHGAHRNGQAIHVSDIDRLDQSLVAASFSPRVAPDSPEIKRFVRVLCRSQAIRRMGSAALNLCYVAAGQLDAYWATSVKQWDIAAGILLVEEAGGVLTCIDGSKFEIADPRILASSTAKLHHELLTTLDAESHSE